MSAQRHTTLSLEEKRQLLAQMLQEKTEGHQAFPLSFAQQRLWFLHQLEPESAVYNVPIAIRLSGRLDVEILKQSLAEIVRRHEVLRTTFTIIEGQPMQVIVPAFEVPVPVVSLLDVPDAQREAETQRLANEEVQHPFDLIKGPVIRVTLLQVGIDEHILVIAIHHIAFDGWSRGILIRELAALYKAFSEGHFSPLAELPVQYADFSHWQREWLQGEVGTTQLAYWKHQVASPQMILELPTDRPRPPIQTFQGSREYFQLDSELTQVLKALSQQSGTTLFMTLLASFYVLLFRYTGQNHIAIGSPIANRNRKEIEPLIGLFLNTLVLQANLSNSMTFAELLSQVRQMALEAYKYQEIPFEFLVEALHPERRLSHTPLFQVLFAFQNIPRTELQLPGLELSPIDLHTGTAKFELSLFLEEDTQGLTGIFEYNTALFNRATISRMTEHLQILLTGIAAHPGWPIAELPILSTGERQQLLVEWNKTDQIYPNDRTIQQMFEAQVERTPDAVAVVFEETSITYRELNNRANHVAYYLHSLGIGLGTLVGICVERSLNMIVGLLGILKAGSAYVPLDPTFPQDRLAFMLKDSEVSVLLTQQSLVDDLPAHMAHVLLLDTNWSEIAQTPYNNPRNRVSGQHLAYVIYTSGSTGKPKGVQIPHRALTNFLRSMQQCPGLVTQDRLLALTTLSFDIAGLELFLPLIIGAQVVLSSRETAIDGAKLADVIERSGTTVMQATPATWELLLESGWQGVRDLKILCGGEALPVKLAEQLLQRVQTVWNMYGPTETTIWSTVYQVALDDTTIPIGLPIANTRVYVVDAHFHVVPVGVPGELCIGGAGLARDYLRRPELTAEKFIPNPFSGIPGDRLYRTGDLVWRLPDGNIQFLGRVDYQVKIRGFRIELGEIETSLRNHPEVHDVVVVDREDSRGDKLLVAYIVPTSVPDRLPYQCDCLVKCDHKLLKLRTEDLSFFGVSLSGFPATCYEGQSLELRFSFPGELHERWLKGEIIWRRNNLGGVCFELSSDEQQYLRYHIENLLKERGFSTFLQRTASGHLRNYLKQTLPEYMIPFSFVFLDRLPLTPNGKVNRAALPLTKNTERPDLEKQYLSPRNAVEKTLAHIWTDVLGIKDIGIKDNFFELGGHSLLAVRLMAKIQETFGKELPLAILFQGATVERLAKLLGQHANNSSVSNLINIQPLGPYPPFFWVHPAGGTVLCYTELAKHLGDKQPFYGIQSEGLAGGHVSSLCIKDMATTYIHALQTVQPEGPYFLGGWSMGGIVAFEMAQQLSQKGHQVALLALIDSRAPSGEHLEDNDDVRLLRMFFKQISPSLTNSLTLSDNDLRRLPSEGRISHVLEQAHKSGLVHPSINHSQIRHLWEIFNVNIRAMRAYVPQVYSGRITLFQARERKNRHSNISDWSTLSPVPLESYVTPGDHDTMLSLPHVQVLAQQLTACVEKIMCD